MLRNTLSILVIGLSLSCFAQTEYQVSGPFSGNLSRGNVADDFFLGATLVHNASVGGSSNVWSIAVNIPFNFVYYGDTLSQFVVSKNGLISFDPSLANQPVSTANNSKSPLPNPSLPAKCMPYLWQDASTFFGTNFNVYTVTYGTAPNREFWILSQEIRYSGVTGAFTHGVVLEEGSNKIHFVEMDRTFGSGNTDFVSGLHYDQQSYEELPGSPSFNFSPTSSIASDNQYYTFTPFIKQGKDLALTGSESPRGAVDCVDPFKSLILNVRNVGDTLIDFTSENATVSYAFTGPNNSMDSGTISVGTIAKGASKPIYIGTADLSTPGTYDLTAIIRLPADSFTSNDTLRLTGIDILDEISLPFSEDFDPSFAKPSGWVIDNNSPQDWKTISNHGTNGSKALVFEGDFSNTSSAAVLPGMDISSTKLRVSFDYRILRTFNYPNQTAFISSLDSLTWSYSKDCANTFTQAASYDGTELQSATSFNTLSFIVDRGSPGPIVLRLEAFRFSGDFVDIDHINITPVSDVDLAINGLFPDLNDCIGTNEDILVELKNNGTQTIQFANRPARVDYSLSGGQTATFSDSITTGSLEPDNTLLLDLGTLSFNPSPSNYTQSVSVTIADDLNQFNDSLSRTVSNASPSTTTPPYAEDFETFTSGNQASDFKNGWTTNNPSSSTAGGWVVNSGSAPGFNSGPDVDHTTGTATGKYIVFDDNSDEERYLISPCMDLGTTGGQQVEFYTHMYGDDITTLSLDIFSKGKWKNIWSLKGQQQNSSSAPWEKQSVSILGYTGSAKFRFRKASSTGFSFNAAIDDFGITDRSPSDLSVENMQVDGTNVCPDTLSAKVWIRNKGILPFDLLGDSLAIAYSLSGPVSQTGNFTVTADSLQVDEQLFVRLPAGPALSSGTYTLEVRINPIGDQNSKNDTLRSTFTLGAPDNIQISSLPYLEDFEGFSLISSNPVNSQGWDDTSNTGSSFNGRTSIETGGSFNEPAVDHTTGTALGQFLELDDQGFGGLGYSAVRTPCYNLGALPPVNLRFFYFIRTSFSSGNYVFEVIAHTKDTSKVIHTIFGDQQQNSSDPWREALVDLSGLSGNVQFELRFSNGDDPFFVDDWELTNRPAHDLSFLAIKELNYSSCLKDTIPLTALITNKGIQTQVFSTDSLQVNLNLSGNSNIVYNQTINSGTLAPGDTLEVLMGNHNLALGSLLFVEGDLNYAPDADNRNDSLSQFEYGVPSILENSTYPYFVPFNNMVGFGNNTQWAQGMTAQASQTGVYEWLLRAPSLSTFNPTAEFDHTTGTNSGKMATLIHNDNHQQNQEAALYLPCMAQMDTLNQPFLEFYYHSIGNASGILRVQALINGSWTTLWSVEGPTQNNPRDAYKKGMVELSPYVVPGSTLKLRFNYLQDKTIFGFFPVANFVIDDVLIDDLVFYDLEPIRLTTPTKAECLSSATPISVELKSQGLKTVDFNSDTLFLSAQITGPINTTIDTLITIDSLPSQMMRSYTIGYADMSQAGSYSVDVSISHAQDEVKSNDTLFRSGFTQRAILAMEYKQDFETTASNTLPNNWMDGPSHDGFATSASQGNFGSKGLSANLWNNQQQATVFSPQIGPLLPAAELNFDYRLANFLNYPNAAVNFVPGDSVVFSISDDCGASFTRLLKIDHTNAPTTAWQSFSTTLSAYTGETVTIKAEAYWRSGSWLVDMDNFNVEVKLVEIARTSKDSLCQGDSLFVSYNVKQPVFNPGNTFEIQLSDSTGDFSSPLLSQSITSVSNDSLGFSTASLTPASGYRWRVISSDPVDTSSAYSPAMTLFALPVVDAGADTSTCPGVDLQLSANSNQANLSYLWSPSEGLSDSTSAQPVLNLSNTSASVLLKTYTVEARSPGGCLAKDSLQVSIWPQASYQALSDTILCPGGMYDLSQGASNLSQFALNGVSVGSNMLDLNTQAPGSYALSYLATDTATGCTTMDTALLNIRPPIVNPIYTIDNDSCEASNGQVGLSVIGPYELTVSGSSSDSLITGLSAGSYAVSVVDTLAGCQLDTSITIQDPNPADPIILNLAANYCQNDDPVVLQADSIGGVFTGPGMVNDSLFDPSLAPTGSITLIYNLNNRACLTSDTQSVLINPVPSLNLSADTSVCLDAASWALNATPSGGSWSGNGLSGNTFNPVAAGGGVHVLTYTYSDGICTAEDSFSIQVDSLPLVAFDGGNPDSLCANAGSVLLSASPSGGVFAGSGVDPTGLFDPSAAPIGSNSLVYTFTDGNGCSARDTFDMEVLPLPSIQVGNDTAVCLTSSPFNLQASPAGGTWSGTGVNGTNFEPSLSDTGSFELLYVVSNSQGCTDTARRIVDVEPLPTYSVSLVQPSICGASDGRIELTVESTESVFFASGTTGPVDSNLSAGVYPFTIQGAGGCLIEDTAVLNDPGGFTLNASEQNASYCGLGDGQISISPQGSSGPFTFNLSGDTTLSNSSGVFDSLRVGSYAVTVLNTATNCQAFLNKLNVGFDSTSSWSGLDSAYCLNTTVDTLTFSPAEAIAEGAGIVAGHRFDPQLAGVGQHVIRFYVPGTLCNDTLYDTVEVSALPMVSAGTDTSLCIDAGILTLNGQPSGGNWTGTAVSGTSFDPQSAGPGTFMLSYSYSDGFCTASDTLMVVVDSLPLVEIDTNSLPDSLCSGDTVQNLSAQPSGGTWSGPGIVSPNQFDPGQANTGTNTLLYQFQNANGCQAEDSIQVVVLAQPSVEAGQDTTLCTADGDYTLNGSPAGGSWSGPSLADSIFDAQAAGGGSYTLYYEVSNLGCVSRDSVQIQVDTLPSPPVIVTDSLSGDLSLLSGASAQWLLNDSLIGTGSSWTPQEDGSYRAIVNNGTCTSDTSSPFLVTALPEQVQQSLKVYPNPADAYLHIQTGKVSMVEVQLIDALGKQTYRFPELSQQTEGRIYTGKLPDGVYILRIRTAEGMLYRRVVIQ